MVVAIQSGGKKEHNKANALGRQKSATPSSLCFLPPVICGVGHTDNT